MYKLCVYVGITSAFLFLWKILFQMKLREAVAETQQNLPLRLRIFEKFP